MTTLEKPVDVAEYLFKRLSECGVQSVHGVPGDYNLVALDYLPEAGLKWVGSVNELNAGKFLISADFSILLELVIFIMTSLLGGA